MKRPVARPVVRYHGGKFLLAPWVVSHMPAHRIYVEPFGGAASVLMQKPRCYSEVYNDLDIEMVNLFRVLRDHGLELQRSLELTPFAREEFRESYLPSADPVEQARRTVSRCFMGYGSTAHNSASRTGFRAKAYRQNQTGARDWANYPQHMPAMIDRLRGVLIENAPALDLIARHDTSDTLFYCDPPYPHETRSSLKGERTSTGKHCYRFEMTTQDHTDLAEVLSRVAGMVIVSGYPCDLYDRELYRGWLRRERRAFADGARARTEVLWLNPAAAAAVEERLFA